jgi:hypothetical protein
MIETSIPDTGGWWLRRLATQLMAKHDHYIELEEYFNNEHLLPSNSSKAVRLAYQRLMDISRMNWAELIVEAPRERMQVQGFRTGAKSDEGGDQAAWQIWQANSLDADSGLVHRASLIFGCSYVIVGGPEDEIGGAPVITIEDPRQVAVSYDPRYRRKPRAAVKLYFDDMLDRWSAWLYLPGVVRQAVSGPASEYWDPVAQDWQNWNWVGPPMELPATARNLVPVVAFGNQVDIKGCHWGEFERHTPTIDRINYQILQRLEVATLQAFRQRAIKADLPTHDAQGNEIDYNDIFAADPGALWQLPATAELWESGGVDLNPILQSVKADVADLAAATRTPLYYVTPDAANGSAEGAATMKEGLLAKVGDRSTQAGESWEQVISYAFTVLGDATRANRLDMEVIWADPSFHSLAERYDAATKAVTAGVPWRQRMVLLGYTPAAIERMEADRAADALIASLSAPPTQIATQGPPGSPQAPPEAPGATTTAPAETAPSATP